MAKRLHPVTPAQRLRILKRDNYTCQYCFEGATEVDHVVPHSYDADSSDLNLVASCMECNRLASNMHFPNFIQKYMYIKQRRHERGDWRRNPTWHDRVVRTMMDTQGEAPEPVKVVKLPKIKVIKPPIARVIKPLKEKIVKPPVPRPFMNGETMEISERYRLPVTDALKNHISNLRNGQTWRALRDELPGWKWSHALLADIAAGKVFSTSLAVYEVLGIMPPRLIIASPGSIIVGSGQGLLSPDQPVVYIAMPPDEWKRHSIHCAVCGAPCPRWSSTQKYCEKHSWQTNEGKKYHRGCKAAI